MCKSFQNYIKLAGPRILKLWKSDKFNQVLASVRFLHPYPENGERVGCCVLRICLPKFRHEVDSVITWKEKEEKNYFSKLIKKKGDPFTP